MKEGATRRLICFVLVFVFMMQQVPAEAIHPGFLGDETGQETEETELAAEAYVVGEVDELREEAVKHFRMDDGGFIAVQYDGPVHYEDANGVWQEIDNTLQRIGERYVAENGALRKAFAATLESGQLFETSYQGYSVGMSLVTKLTGTAPVQPGLEIMEAVAEEAAAEPTPPAETAAEAGTGITEEAAAEGEAQAQTEQAETPAADAPVPETEAAVPVEAEQPQQELARFALVKGKNVKAQVENPESVQKAAGKTSNEQMITPEKLTSSVHFADVFENTNKRRYL